MEKEWDGDVKQDGGRRNDVCWNNGEGNGQLEQGEGREGGMEGRAREENLMT